MKANSKRSSRLYSARFLQVAFTLQNRQWSPALNSPPPTYASCAVGARISSAHFRSSSLEMV